MSVETDFQEIKKSEQELYACIFQVKYHFRRRHSAKTFYAKDLTNITDTLKYTKWHLSAYNIIRSYCFSLKRLPIDYKHTLQPFQELNACNFQVKYHFVNVT